MSGEERRTQITEVAIDLFSRKGFSGTTTKEIAAAAGVTEAIIFRHFDTKQALYNAIIDYRLDCLEAEEFLSELETLMSREDDEGIFRMIAQAVVKITREDPKFERLMTYAALEGHEMAILYHKRLALPFVDKLRDYVARRQATGALAGSNPDMLFFAAVGMSHHYAQTKYLFPFKKIDFPDEEAISFFTRTLMDGARLSEPKPALRTPAPAGSPRKPRKRAKE
jgi:TetR/AcrR family transcriptional regulator